VGRTVLDAIVDGKRKPLREKAVIAEVTGVNPCAELERVYIGEKRIKEVVTQTCYLALVEPVAAGEVFLCLAKYLDLHVVASRMFRFASTQSVN
jgi:hypothetical protein